MQHMPGHNCAMRSAAVLAWTLLAAAAAGCLLVAQACPQDDMVLQQFWQTESTEVSVAFPLLSLPEVQAVHAPQRMLMPVPGLHTGAGPLRISALPGASGGVVLNGTWRDITVHMAAMRARGLPVDASPLQAAPAEARHTTQTGGSHQLRLSVEYLDLMADSDMDSDMADLVKNDIVPAAQAALEQVLRVKDFADAGEPLYYQRPCFKYWSGTPARCKEPSAAAVYCAKLDDGADNVAVPESLIGPREYWPSSSGASTMQAAGGAGVANADMHVFVTAHQTSRCGSNTIAYAITCDRHPDSDRPTFARLNLCPAKLPASADAAQDLAKAIDTATHELLHALGFSANSWHLFRDTSSNEPLTSRDPQFPWRTASGTSVTYTCETGTSTTNRPSGDTIDFMAERGTSDCDAQSTPEAGQCVARVVAAPAPDVARWYFNCDNVPGIELENQATSSCRLLGSHLEQRSGEGDLMVGVTTSFFRALTPLSLGVMEASGWYYVDWDQVATIRPQSHFGFRAGCDVAMSKCVQTQGDLLTSSGSPLPRFCVDSSAAKRCSPDRSAMGECSSSMVRYGSDLPAQFQYFSDSTLGGRLKQADYCPRMSLFGNRHCSDTAQSPNEAGGNFGKDGVCMETTLASPGSSAQFQGSCYRTRCTTDKHMEVLVINSDGDEVWALCPDEGGDISVSGMDGKLTCPPASAACGPALKFDYTASGKWVDAEDGPGWGIFHGNADTESPIAKFFTGSMWYVGWSAVAVLLALVSATVVYGIRRARAKRQARYLRHGNAGSKEQHLAAESATTHSNPFA